MISFGQGTRAAGRRGIVGRTRQRRQERRGRRPGSRGRSTDPQLDRNRQSTPTARSVKRFVDAAEPAVLELKTLAVVSPRRSLNRAGPDVCHVGSVATCVCARAAGVLGSCQIATPLASVPILNSRIRTLLAANGKGPTPYRTSPTRGRRHPILALHAAAAQTSGPHRRIAEGGQPYYAQHSASSRGR